MSTPRGTANAKSAPREGAATPASGGNNSALSGSGIGGIGFSSSSGRKSKQAQQTSSTSTPTQARRGDDASTPVAPPPPPPRFLTLRASTSDFASTSAEHVVQSRILISAEDAKALSLGNGDPCMVSPPSSASGFAATAWTRKNQAKGTMMMSRALGEVVMEFTKVSSASETIHNNLGASVFIHLVVRPLCRDSETTPRLALDVRLALSSLSSDFAAYVLDGSIVTPGTTLCLKLGGVAKTMKVLTCEGAEKTGESSSLACWRIVASRTRIRAGASKDEDSAPKQSSLLGSSQEVELSSFSQQKFVGYQATYAEFLDNLRFALDPQHVDRLARLGVKSSRGGLLYGPAGCGKTSMARFAIWELCSKHHPSLRVHWVSASSENFLAEFHAIFAKRFSASSPCLMVVDDADQGGLAPKLSESEEGGSGSEEVIRTICRALDSSASEMMSAAGKSTSSSSNAPLWYLLCLTRGLEAVDGRLRRPGRLAEDAVEMVVPDAKDRSSILSSHLSKYPCDPSCEELGKAFGPRAHGFVASDLVRLAKEAAWIALAENCALVTHEHASKAFKKTSPSALREIAVQVPSVRWSDVGGMDHVKAALKEAVELPMKKPEAFKRLGIKPPSGVLLYGPPGCSKTMLAKCVATESDMNFIAVKGPELLSKWVGDSEKAIQLTFKRARSSKPCVVFFDEIDALAGGRRGGGGGGSSGVTSRVQAQLLQELDGIEDREGVVVLCATNRPDLLDSALTRPGRLDRLVYVPPPDLDARAQILMLNLSKMPHKVSQEEMNNLAKMTDGCSGAEVAAVCRDAALDTIKRDQAHVTFETLERAVQGGHRQITSEMLAFYEAYRARIASS